MSKIAVEIRTVELALSKIAVTTWTYYMTTTDPSIPPNSALNERLDSAASALSEHFDSVLIIATRRINGTTSRLSSTAGSYFASYGAAKQWVIEEEEDVRVFARRNRE